MMKRVAKGKSYVKPRMCCIEISSCAILASSPSKGGTEGWKEQQGQGEFHDDYSGNELN